MSKVLIEGDRVKFIDEAGEATFRRILNNESAEVDVDGIAITVPLKWLVKINPEDIHAYERTCIHIRKTKKRKNRSDSEDPAVLRDGKLRQRENETKRKKNNPVPEIDLHIEKLVDDYSDLTNFEIVKLQLRHFHRFLEDAIEKMCEKIIVIHGIGEGKLKKEIYHILSDYEGLSHSDAPYELYGGGATMITLNYIG